MMNNLIGKIELSAVHDSIEMRCPGCSKTVFSLLPAGVETAVGLTVFKDGDTVDLIHTRASSLWKKRPYTLSATAVWGECRHCEEIFYAIEIGVVDVEVAETFTDRYFDHNLPCSSKPRHELASLMPRDDVNATLVNVTIPWWFVDRYESEIGTVLSHTIGGWTAQQLLAIQGLDVAKYFDDAFMCRVNTPAKYQITIQDMAGKLVAAFLPEVYELAVSTRKQSLETPWQTLVSENRLQAVPVETRSVHFVPGIPN